MVTAAIRIAIAVVFYCAICKIVDCNESAIKVPNADHKCPKGSVLKHLPHETNCSLFYKCMNGKAALIKCPLNLHFNRHKYVCDYPENAGCTKDISKDQREKSEKESPNGKCPPKNPAHPVLLPHISDCTKFYICDAGVPHVKSCQPGLHFNAKIEACDYPDKAGCDSEATCDYPENAGCETSVTKVPKGKVGKESFKQSCELAADGTPLLIPHESDCRKYYNCHNGVLYPHICQSGLHFNSKLQACDYPDKAGCETEKPRGKGGLGDSSDGCQNVRTDKTVLVPHPNDCSRYFMCDSGFSYLKACPAGLHFNPALQSCDYPSNVQCNKSGSNKKD
ncbi:putative chitinase 10 [Trichonephila inaurata madagascariensis]|uniref:Putative chitinase 10 n=1 Tax=Trichonephila inaurata madagascariensis TaxID=2747483 RepID=A0A8X6Y5I8_9ARAC|nr:putative chitinase 10 [Trichonephila inaurata madagascariensis]